ncbi:MAG: serine/threonine-protein kinase [Polyangiaceae bacterium]|jgi:eukaryotic-like serine/threonine-protein kinase
MQLEANVVVAERFRLNRLLGRGGMGSVWHATHLGLDVPCAVKFIEGEYAQLPEAQSRFEREAKAAASLRSPHVVQILDHGVWQGTPYIAMELLDGEELGKRLQRLGRLSPHDVLKIVTQVARALTKAHAIGVVHRDLKPENVFLVRDDDREIAKVLDFGIAKATGAIEGSNTKTGAMLGTPYYMSPEQAQGIKAVDNRSDLWALAVIVFQALTGRLPFESEALGDLLVRIIVAPIPMPSQIVGDLPPGFDMWWAKASQRDPALRYQSAKEFSDALLLVFGQSTGNSLGDSQAGIGGSASAAMNVPAYALTPGGYNSSSHLGMTPSPAGMTPQPMGMTPLPGGGTPQTMGFGTNAVTTGAPIAHTFAGFPGGPKPKTGLLLAAGGAALVVVIGVVGVSIALKGKQAPTPAAASGMVATALPPAVAPPATVAPAPTHETLAQPASEASQTPAAALSVTRTRPQANVVAGPLPGAKSPAPQASPPPAKKQKVDLGI